MFHVIIPNGLVDSLKERHGSLFESKKEAKPFMNMNGFA